MIEHRLEQTPGATFGEKPQLKRNGQPKVKGPSKLEDAKFYRLKEVALATGLSVATLRRACLKGELAFTRTTIGATSPLRIRGEDVQAWLAKARRENRRVLDTRETAAVRRRAI